MDYPPRVWIKSLRRTKGKRSQIENQSTNTHALISIRKTGGFSIEHYISVNDGRWKKSFQLTTVTFGACDFRRMAQFPCVLWTIQTTANLETNRIFSVLNYKFSQFSGKRTLYIHFLRPVETFCKWCRILSSHARTRCTVSTISSIVLETYTSNSSSSQ